MEDTAWIVPAAGVIGVPLVIAWAKSQIEKGDKAQQTVLDRLERDVEMLREEISNKADSRQIHDVLMEVRGVGTKVESLNNLVLTELGKRPTREEVNALFQARHG